MPDNKKKVGKADRSRVAGGEPTKFSMRQENLVQRRPT